MNIFGVRVDEVTLEEAVEKIELHSRSGDGSGGEKPFFVVTPNPEQIVQAQGDSEFRRALNSADLAIPDGVGLRLVGVKTRVSGVELMEALVPRFKRVMLVGGRGETASRAAQALSIKYPVLSIKGIRGIKNIKKIERNEEKELIKKINDFRPELLLVGFGAPEQEKWVVRQLQATSYKLQAKCVMVVGGALDQVANPSLRPPKWLDRLGFGWLYRLIREPWRWRRQLRLVKFGWMVVDRLVRVR